MVHAPDDRRPRPQLLQDGAASSPASTDKPILRVTAGAPDHKALLRALRWLKTQAPPTNGSEVLVIKPDGDDDSTGSP